MTRAAEAGVGRFRFVVGCRDHLRRSQTTRHEDIGHLINSVRSSRCKRHLVSSTRRQKQRNNHTLRNHPSRAEASSEQPTHRSMLSATRMVFPRAGNPSPRSTVIHMHRWTARFLLLAMLLPVLGPLALARAVQPEAMHCVRKPLQPATQTNQPAMHCHHAIAQAPAPGSPATSFNSLDCCCQNHDCCRGLKTSEWARPASNLLSYVSLPIEPAPAPQFAAQISADPTGQDSTRAPPRS